MDTRKPAFRNLQPRAAAAIDFNDSDDDEGGLLSADYRAQRKTTQDLVEFFKTAPPPPPSPSNLPFIVVDEKKKRTLLQRLRSRKLSSSARSGNRNNTLATPQSGMGSTISTGSELTLGKGNEVATLPNGRKYIMIAVDYKDKAVGSSTSIPGSTTTGGMSSTSTILIAKTTEASPSPKRLSKNSVEDNSGFKRRSVLNTINNNSIQVTTAFQELQSNDKATNFGDDQRRSIIIQAGGGESANFILDNTPFLLDNFALDTDFVTPSAAPETESGPQSATSEQDDDAKIMGLRRSISLKSSLSVGSEKRNNKVKFNITETQTPMDEESVSAALVQRIANHKAEMSKNKDLLTDAANLSITSKDKFNQSREIEFPKPVTRKKVRHVQIQTQHCIMRPMYTQTESLVHDLQVKELGISTNDMSTSTAHDDPVSRTTVKRTTSTATSTCSVSHPKVVGMVPSFSQPVSPTAAATKSFTSNGTSTTANSASEQDELVQLRQQNAVLQAQVASLQNDLAAEMRARARSAVAMQDTRDKFEMLSAMAYKKIKEMVFQRHVLEMEVRELRAEVDV